MTTHRAKNIAIFLFTVIWCMQFEVQTFGEDADTNIKEKGFLRGLVDIKGWRNRPTDRQKNKAIEVHIQYHGLEPLPADYVKVVNANDIPGPDPDGTEQKDRKRGSPYFRNSQAFVAVVTTPKLKNLKYTWSAIPAVGVFYGSNPGESDAPQPVDPTSDLVYYLLPKYGDNVRKVGIKVVVTADGAEGSAARYFPMQRPDRLLVTSYTPGAFTSPDPAAAEPKTTWSETRVGYLIRDSGTPVEETASSIYIRETLIPDPNEPTGWISRSYFGWAIFGRYGQSILGQTVPPNVPLPMFRTCPDNKSPRNETDGVPLYNQFKDTIRTAPMALPASAPADSFFIYHGDVVHVKRVDAMITANFIALTQKRAILFFLQRWYAQDAEVSGLLSVDVSINEPIRVRTMGNDIEELTQGMVLTP